MPVKSLKGGIGVRPLGFGLGAAEEETEPNFNQTVLLLHADGSEGAGDTSNLGDPNYKAFKDNSTSAHALAVAGDAYGNDFSPYYYADGYWSNLFTVNNTTMSLTSTAALQLSGVFTVECWINLKTLATDGGPHPSILTFPTNGSYQTQLYLNSSNDYVGWYYNGDIVKTTNNSISLNTWHHIAVARDASNQIALWLDGTRISALATGQSTSYGNTSGTFYIGSFSTTGELDGYISNVRIVKGYDVYGTTNTSITVPTTPLTAITGTSLLTCQSNRFIDNASSPHALTVGSGQSISTNTPFTVTKTANVGAGFFDGNTDNLTTSGSSDFAFGTGDFTAEAWVYPSSLPSTAVVLDLRYNNNANTDNISALTLFGSTLGSFIGANKTAGSDIPVVIGQWNHIVVQRISSTLYFAVNGKVSSTTVASSDNLNNTNQRATVGGNVDQTTVSMYTGYIADLRVVNGTGVYGTSNFDVPTTSLTAVTNTKFLTCQYSGAVRNVGFLDDSKYNHRITRNGDVSIGTFSPFSLEDGYWSYYGGNTGGYYFADSADLEIGTSDFTIEFWMNLDTISGGDYLTGKVPSSGAGGDTAFQIYMSGSGGVINFWLQDTSGTTTISTPSSTISAHTWHFISCVRQSGTMRLYVDGVQKATGTRSGSVKDVAGGVGIGMTGEYADYLAGYMSNYRFVIGTCLRNDGTTFSVPTTPLTSTGSETKILTAQSNKFVDNSSTGRTPVLSGTAPKILPFSPLAPSRSYSKDAVGGSVYYDGTGDYLTYTTDNATPRLSTNWSIEFWMYLTARGSHGFLQQHGGSAGDFNTTNGMSFQFYEVSSTMYWQPANGAGGYVTLSTATLPPLFAWTHMVISNDGTQTSVFMNGVRVLNGTTGYEDMHNATTSNKIQLGYLAGSDYPTDGYFTGLQYHNTEVYDASSTTITVPTAPKSADANTLLLSNFTNAGIIDHTMKNNLETENNTRVSGQQVKFGTGSMYLDGTGDYLFLPSNDNLVMGTGDFTFEMFFYYDAASYADGYLIDQRNTASQAAIAVYIQASTGKFIYYVSGSARINDATPASVRAWQHFALVRYNGTTTIYVNGTASGSTYSDSNNYVAPNTYIGARFNATSPFNGYMDDIRMTKGVARYTSNFTAPTKAFANR